MTAAQKAGSWRAIHLILLVSTVVLWFGCALNTIQRHGGCHLPYWQRFYVATGPNSEIVAHPDDGDDAAVSAYKEDRVIATASAHWNVVAISLPFTVYSNRQLTLDGYVLEHSNPSDATTALAAFATLRLSDTSGACSNWTQFNIQDATITDPRFQLPLTKTRHNFSLIAFIGCIVFWGLPVLTVVSRSFATHWKAIATGRNRLTCPTCNYDIKGLPSPICPECGTQRQT